MCVCALSRASLHRGGPQALASGSSLIHYSLKVNTISLLVNCSLEINTINLLVLVYTQNCLILASTLAHQVILLIFLDILIIFTYGWITIRKYASNGWMLNCFQQVYPTRVLFSWLHGFQWTHTVTIYFQWSVPRHIWLKMNIHKIKKNKDYMIYFRIINCILASARIRVLRCIHNQKTQQKTV